MMPQSTSLAQLTRRFATLVLLLTASATLVACDDDTPPSYVPDAYETWIMHEPEGAVCADGTQYRYFTKHREDAENVLVLFEGGGACWNWETCTAAAGSLGALGVDCVMSGGEEHCIRENYADTYYPLPPTIPPSALDLVQTMLPSWADLSIEGVAIDTVLPLGSRGAHGGENVSPMHDWNLVFVPYCTSDLYAGNKKAEYVNPEDPDDKVTFLHYGLSNTLAVAEELDVMFPRVPQFAMNGCSAGGAGVMATYHFFRSKMSGIERGYVFSDAGPFFPTTPDNARSRELHQAVREAWDVSSIFSMLIEERPDIISEEPEDVSDLYRILSETYPDDRFSVAHTQTDFNYSLYSYTSFNDLHYRGRNPEDAKTIYQFWKDDNDNLMDVLDGLDNFSYFMPFWRRTNDSHCISLIGINDINRETGDEVSGLLSLIKDPVPLYYSGTEIEEDGVTYNYRDHVMNVLNDDEPLWNMVELEADEYMGLRKYCTPDYNPGNDHLCYCSFNETPEDLPEGICDCYHQNPEATPEEALACFCGVEANQGHAACPF